MGRNKPEPKVEGVTTDVPPNEITDDNTTNGTTPPPTESIGEGVGDLPREIETLETLEEATSEQSQFDDELPNGDVLLINDVHTSPSALGVDDKLEGEESTNGDLSSTTTTATDSTSGDFGGGDEDSQQTSEGMGGVEQDPTPNTSSIDLGGGSDSHSNNGDSVSDSPSILGSEDPELEAVRERNQALDPNSKCVVQRVGNSFFVNWFN
jgi:hypothetical protein